MYYNYKEVLNIFKNDYNLKKAIGRKELYKIRPGVYSYEGYTDEYEIIFSKYKQIVLTLQSAFYHHNITDYIPNYIYLATPKNSYPLNSNHIKQIFMTKKYFEIGITDVSKNSYRIKVYDLERTLIELIRYQTKIPYEEYQHVLKKIRASSDKLDYKKLIKYAKNFKSYKKIMNTIQNSIM